MKRKLGIIILAILLCAVLAFTLVACGNKNGGNSGGSGDNTTDNSGSSSGSLEGVTDQQIAAVEADLQTYLNTWVSMHATEGSEDQKGLLKNDLTAAKNSYKLKGTDAKSYAPTFTVTYKDGKYTVKASWNQGALTRTFTVQAQTVTYANWAGKHSRTANYSYLEDEDEALDLLTVAFVNSANKVTANAVTGKFGLDGTLGFDAFGANYALRVKGNVDVTSAKDTEIGLVIEDGDGAEVAGIYYKGADEVKDNRVYIQYPVTENGQKVAAYKYIEYADVLGLVNSLLKDSQGNSIVKERAGEGVFDDGIDGLAALLDSFDVDAKISGMIPGIVKLVAKAYKDGDRYLIDINLAEVMNQVSSIMDMVGNVQLDFLDKIGLDLSTMHGLRGHISISAKVNTVGGKDYLSDFELAVNIPEETTFYFSDAEDAMKFDLPSIGFAIYLEDFSFVTSGETKIANVVPQKAIDNANAGKGYFSPTNLDLSGDLYINHAEGEEASIDSTFHFQLVTDVNPLEIIEKGFNSTARAALVIKEHAGKKAYVEAEKAEWSNFLSISYEQETKLFCVSGTVFGLEDGGNTVYTYNLYTKDDKGNDVVNVAEIIHWIGLDNWIGLVPGENGGIVIKDDKDNGPAKPAAKAIFGNELVQEIIAMFLGGGDDEEDEGEIGGEGKVGEDGGVAEATIMDDLGKYVDGVKAIYENLVEKGVIAFETDPFSLSINVTDKTIEDVIKAINDTFDAGIPTDVKALKDLKLVKVEANTEGYADKVYIKVVYGSNTYELTFDGSSDESRFVITFKMTKDSGRTYTVEFNALSAEKTWTASVFFDIKDDKGANVNHTEVTLSNYHGEWGNDNTTEIAVLLREIKGAENRGSIFPADERATGIGPATATVQALLNALSSDKAKGYVEMIAGFISEQFAA